jgi:hypothetical protein
MRCNLVCSIAVLSRQLQWARAIPTPAISVSFSKHVLSPSFFFLLLFVTLTPFFLLGVFHFLFAILLILA